MKTYICHFDASLKNGKAACAFIVRCNGKPVYHDVVITPCSKSDVAESNALFFLLTYINNNIESGCKIKIHGDAKGLIDSINNNGPRYPKQVVLYKKLGLIHKIKLNYISRKLNIAADTIARKAITDEKYRNICLKDIIISENHVLPGPKKLHIIEEYFKQTGKIFTDIRVSHNNRLICGYGEYVTLLNANVEYWTVYA